MSLILRNCCEPLSRFESERDRVWRYFLAPVAPFEAPQTVAPSVDLVETENEVIVKAELPGLTDKEINVTVADDALTIKGEKRESKEEKGERYHFAERRYGAFERRVRLPAPVDAKAAKAKFENGVLEITLPKAEERKPRKIEVN